MQRLQSSSGDSGAASLKFKWVAIMFDFKRATVFLFGTPLFKAKMTKYAKMFEGGMPLRPSWLRLRAENP